MIVDHRPLPLEELEQKEVTSILCDEIDSLPENYRVVLSMFYFQELSYEKISDTLQLPIGTVKTHLFRARVMVHNAQTAPENSHRSEW